MDKNKKAVYSTTSSYTTTEWSVPHSSCDTNGRVLTQDTKPGLSYPARMRQTSLICFAGYWNQLDSTEESTLSLPGEVLPGRESERQRNVVHLQLMLPLRLQPLRFPPTLHLALTLRSAIWSLCLQSRHHNRWAAQLSSSPSPSAYQLLCRQSLSVAQGYHRSLHPPYHFSPLPPLSRSQTSLIHV
jgi:hypothetical protein